MPRGGPHNRKSRLSKQVQSENDPMIVEDETEKFRQEEDELLNSGDDDPAIKVKGNSNERTKTNCDDGAQVSASTSQVSIQDDNVVAKNRNNNNANAIIQNIVSTDANVSSSNNLLQIPEFTPTGRINALPLGSVSGIYVGIVYSITGPSYANKSRVMHIVLHNNDGEYMQISGWGGIVDRINAVVKHGMIMMGKGLKVIQSDRKSDYFFGNTDQHLQILDSSNFEVMNLPPEQIAARLESRNSSLIDVPLKDVLNHNGIIRVKGHVKIPLHFNRGSSSEIIGTITDGTWILDVIIQSNVMTENINRGHEIELIGEVKENSRNEKHHLLVRSLNDLRLISTKKDSVHNIMSAHTHL